MKNQNILLVFQFVMDNELVRSGGIILIDNVLWMGEVYPIPNTEPGKLFYNFNEFVSKDTRVSQVSELYTLVSDKSKIDSSVWRLYFKFAMELLWLEENKQRDWWNPMILNLKASGNAWQYNSPCVFFIYTL